MGAKKSIHDGDTVGASTMTPPSMAHPLRKNLRRTLASSGRWHNAEYPRNDTGVAEHARQLRQRRAAKRLVDAEEEAAHFTLPPSTLTLANELAVDDGPLQYTIEQVHPMGTNSLLAASYKTGKTTLLANLLKAMADGVPFLGELNIMRACHVAYWNYELTRQQFRVWLRRIGVRHPENAAVWNLRGYRLPLGVSSVEDLAVEWLLERDIDALILDPFTKAYGGNENDNSAITEWTDALDVIKQRANVQDLFLAAHFGRAPQEEGAERARGGTRIDDWPDARWILTKQAGIRYFSAEGRDVAYIERSLSFDPQTYRLYLEGGSRAQERDDRQLLADVADVVAACQHEPGITTGDLEKHVSGNKQRKSRAIREAIARGEVRTDKSGKQTHHYVKERTE